MQAQFDQVVFAFDFSRVETVLGARYLVDYGPNQFSFQFPGGAADPAVGLDGSLYFSGLPQYLSLPAGRLASFYATLPTQAMTILVAYRPVTLGGTIFSCWNSAGGGINQGLTLLNQIGATVAPRLYQFQGAAGQPYMMASTAHGASGKRVVAYAMEAAPRGLTDNMTNAPTWVVGAFGVTSYDVTMVPRIGCYPSLASGYAGYLWYLALVRGALSSSDLSELSAMMATGGRPFCWRAV